MRQSINVAKLTTNLLKDSEKREEFHATLNKVENKVSQMIGQMGNKSPHVAGADGIYDDLHLDWWTSGFWPGMLWIMYDMTGDEQYKNAAWRWDELLEQKMIQPNNFHHDVGFQFLPTAVIKYKLTKDEDALRRGLFAANFLAGRFNIEGRFLRAWNQEKLGWSIIDSCMNLPLLFWAAKQSEDPRFDHIAKAHADTVIQHFIRPDGSVCHIVSFDPESGEFIESLGGQGAGPDSGWSRGAAWALYGMASAYKETGEERYLHASKRVAHYFLANLPEDDVPHWDFRAAANLSDEPRDTSAAACAASGLLDLSLLLPEVEGTLYRQSALRILRSLDENYATWSNPAHEAILLHATGHKPAGQNIDISLIYGDYFFVEAVAKLNGWSNNIF